MHKQFSTVLPPFLMVFFEKWTLDQFQGHEEISVLFWQNLKIITFLKLHLLKCQIEFNLFGNWQYLKIMYNSNHKSKVIIRLRLNMNFFENGGCFKDLPLITLHMYSSSKISFHSSSHIFQNVRLNSKFLANDIIEKQTTIKIRE